MIIETMPKAKNNGKNKLNHNRYQRILDKIYKIEVILLIKLMYKLEVRVKKSDQIP